MEQEDPPTIFRYVPGEHLVGDVVPESGQYDPSGQIEHRVLLPSDGWYVPGWHLEGDEVLEDGQNVPDGQTVWIEEPVWQ